MKWLSVFAVFSTALLAAPATGPAVGAKAPAFEARDQNGVSHTLASFLGPKGAILVFYRSADW
jgi:AhpC/TSA family